MRMCKQEDFRLVIDINYILDNTRVFKKQIAYTRAFKKQIAFSQRVRFDLVAIGGLFHWQLIDWLSFMSISRSFMGVLIVRN